jgi:hypothetical protein
MMDRLIVSAACLALAASSVAAEPTSCTLSASDQAWVDRSMQAWNYASVQLSGIGHVKKIQAVLFDKECVVTSTTAMNGGPNSWSGQLHHGTITLPDGGSIKPQVISFAGSSVGSTGTKSFFVMSTPTIWREGVKSGKGTTLENLMTAVMLHEATHVAQMPTYGAAIDRIAHKYQLPEDFNDDSIQKSFKGNDEIASSVEREAKLLFEASQSKTRSGAAALVRQARELMKVRYARWFTGKNSYMAEAEPVFLTLEGSGQWVAYKWEIDPRGAAIKPGAILDGFATDHWWTQREGFAAFMALERLTGSAWKQQAFHRGQKDVLQMLDEAAARYPAAKPS